MFGRRSRLHRRALIGGAAALAIAGRGSASAQDGTGSAQATIRAGRWVEAVEVGDGLAQWIADGQPEPIAFAAPYPFTAVAPLWSGKEPAGATIEVSLSADRAGWGPWLTVGEDPDGGKVGDGASRFGPPILTAPASWVRYRTYDANGLPAALAGMAWEYIDATAGPAAAAQESPPDGAARIVARTAWGADESLRFRDGAEIWPTEYAPVAHAVVHHSDTGNDEDPLAAIRSIYYYHAVTRGWGDIGYNLLVDRNGVVYEGRFGGEGAVGGHALGYNEGTCGICLMGRFADEEPPPAMVRGLESALALVTARAGLDPYGASPLKDIPSLPAVCAHRDVNPTACPGDALYADLAPVRDGVAAIRATDGGTMLAAFQAGGSAVTTATGVALRDGPGLAYPSLAIIAPNERVTVAGGPVGGDGLTWYRIDGPSLSGWVAGDYLAPVASPWWTAPAVGGVGPAGWPSGSVVATVGAVNLRDAPAGSVVLTLPDGAWVEITGVPESVGGVLWYPVDTGTGVVGWASGALLRPA